MKAARFFREVSMALSVLIVMSVTTALVSCADDDDFFAKVEYPSNESGDAILVEAWASEYTFDINSSGSWRIETDDRFFTVSPENGSGNATVTIRVQNNQGDERKVGGFNVIFPGNEKYNRLILVEQKWSGDYDDNAADKIGTSNQVYAIGYSYDTTGEWASPNSVKKEIFDTHILNVEGKHVVGPTQVSLQTNTVTGSSISDMTNALAVKANVEGGFGKFKAEANASFDMNHAKNSNYEYAMTYFNLDVRTASFTTDLRTLCDYYMTDDAWFAINGVPRENKRTGKQKVSYPSTKEGFKSLIENYGTHVIITARLGGRVRHSMEVDISKITSSYDVKAFAKASYEGAFVSGGASVDDKFKQSFEENRKNVTIRLNVLGGAEDKAKALGRVSGFTEENLNAWVQSVTTDNMALVGFDGGSLVPLYELIDESLTLEEDGVDGKKRKEDLKNYMNGEDVANDFSSYDCGTVIEFDVPYFTYRSSYVKDVVIDGQHVAQICNEYIPNINKDNQVAVVYPVINNVARYNMGFFLGNDNHKPARVSWDGTSVALQEYSDLDFGRVEKIYLRGASVSAVKSDDVTAKRGEVKDSYLEYQGVAYSVVKIFDKLWMQGDFQATSKNTGWDLTDDEMKCYAESKDDVGKYFYSPKVVADPNFAPKGWHVATSGEYKAIQDKLVANGLYEVGKMFGEGNRLAFDAKYDGWIDSGVLKPGVISGGYSKATRYLTSDYHYVHIQNDGPFAIKALSHNAPYYMSVRCVKD